jgi:hypothetical protein
MGSQVSKLCRDFKLKSTCISNCCSDKAKNEVVFNDSPKHHKHKHKHKKANKDIQTDNEIIG